MSEIPLCRDCPPTRPFVLANRCLLLIFSDTLATMSARLETFKRSKPEESVYFESRNMETEVSFKWWKPRLMSFVSFKEDLAPLKADGSNRRKVDVGSGVSE